MANSNSNPDVDFQKKIDRAFPESGTLVFPIEGDANLGEVLTTGRAFALALMRNIPHTRERSLAFSRLEECLVWGILGLMRK